MSVKEGSVTPTGDTDVRWSSLSYKRTSSLFLHDSKSPNINLPINAGI